MNNILRHSSVLATVLVFSAAVGTAIGASSTFMGGHNSTGIGAGTGFLIASVAGIDTGDGSGRNLQQGYDFAYYQCIYGKEPPCSGIGAFGFSLACP